MRIVDYIEGTPAPSLPADRAATAYGIRSAPWTDGRGYVTVVIRPHYFDTGLPMMPTKVPTARLVLQDAMYVRHKLEDEIGRIEWRLFWVLAVVLLRAVGHVLDKVDGEADAAVKKAANDLHRAWKRESEHAIFRDFIECERNSILKEYEFAMTEGPVPVMAHLQSHDGFDVVRQFLIEENIYRPMASGPYEGEDGRTLLDQAIAWWAVQLDAVDREDSGTTG